MSEIRQNMATGEWVIIATERAKRPEEFARMRRPLTESRPAYDPGCPFCPGNEEPPPVEILRLPASGPWQVRVVRNKYPALVPDGERVRHFDGVHRSITGVGHHEIIVECPRHNATPALESDEEVARTLLTFRRRGADVARDPRIEQIIYFKNHGPRAGTSLEHPHTQLVALPIVPHNIRVRAEGARRYFDDTGGCVLCRMLADEVSSGQRVVAENAHFVAFIPYAAFSAFHTWIVPRYHQASYLDTEREQVDDLGRILRRVLRKLYCGLRDPDYNYVIRSAPLHERGSDYLHWYVTIVPRVAHTAGFELGSGMFINTALPEDSARFLREVDVGE